jgi:lycopene beta-cyclase
MHGAALAKLVAERDQQTSFLFFLNRLLFEATPPTSRHNIFERFYRLPEGCIARHYAMQLRLMDHLRILGGSPPKGISLARALAALREGLWPAIAPSLHAAWLGQRRGGQNVF